MLRKIAWFSLCNKPAKLKLGKNETTAISLSIKISITVITVIEEVSQDPFYGLVYLIIHKHCKINQIFLSKSFKDFFIIKGFLKNMSFRCLY